MVRYFELHNGHPLLSPTGSVLWEHVHELHEALRARGAHRESPYDDEYDLKYFKVVSCWRDDHGTRYYVVAAEI